MASENLVGLLLRLLPAIIVAVLAFVAAADRKTRARWGDVLFQVGSIRAEQREDPKIGAGVKWPFFIVALFLLIWPVQYYIHASRKIDAGESDLKPSTAASDLKKKSDAAAVPEGTPMPSPTPGPAVHQMDTGTPGSSNVTPGTAPATSGDLKPAQPHAPAPGGTSGDLKPLPR